jgi:hypothetical protein
MRRPRSYGSTAGEAHPEGGLDFYRFEPDTAARDKFLRAPACLNATGREEVNDEAT